MCHNDFILFPCHVSVNVKNQTERFISDSFIFPWHDSQSLGSDKKWERERLWLSEVTSNFHGTYLNSKNSATAVKDFDFLWFFIP